MTLKEAKKRIEALEQKVRELEMRPAQQIHYHYTPVPYYYDWTYRPDSGPWVSIPSVWMDQGTTYGATTTTKFTVSNLSGSDGLQWSNA